MPTMLQEEVEEARETYVSRIILVGGSALFLVGGVSRQFRLLKLIIVWKIRRLLQITHR
ncbi:hypothetical protein ABEO66_02000 [Bacillus pacificus]|uniref:hypothetical protein n=1 Tax=Bacillus pacificus TaxID=2026187 RepID=UPI003D24470B